jgi:hypothetical protein
MSASMMPIAGKEKMYAKGREGGGGEGWGRGGVERGGGTKENELSPGRNL